MMEELGKAGREGGARTPLLPLTAVLFKEGRRALQLHGTIMLIL